MPLPESLKTQLIDAMVNYKDASDALESVAPSYGEWAGYMTQSPYLPGYIAKSNVHIPPDKLPLAQNAWSALDHYSQLIAQAQNSGYDYCKHIMPLARHYMDGHPLPITQN